jgi:hypothetical protein
MFRLTAVAGAQIMLVEMRGFENVDYPVQCSMYMGV